MSFSQILVAIEYSPQAEAVFQRAVDLAKHLQAKLLLFHCFSGSVRRSLPYTDIYGSTLSNFSQDQQDLVRAEVKRSQAWLQDFYDQAQNQGVAVEVDEQIGSPGLAVCEKAQHWGADLIVVGRRGRKGLTEVLLGSVSNYIVHHASCSVLVVQGDE